MQNLFRQKPIDQLDVYDMMDTCELWKGFFGFFWAWKFAYSLWDCVSRLVHAWAVGFTYFKVQWRVFNVGHLKIIPRALLGQ